ncbi:TonB-dependent receptor [Bacteroidia bacterium]|nr:TonB-dependent receptor [Bacteroidia bacterium]
MRLNKQILILFFGLYYGLLFGQECNINITGSVVDLGTGKGLGLVHVHVQELELEQISDSTGKFVFSGVCPGKYHFSFSHIGCESYDLFLVIDQDTMIEVQMDHSFHVSKGVAVKGKHTNHSIQRVELIGEKAIEENPNANLGSMIEGVTGVSTLKNGNAIAKPVVHGLYGNRITILNHGIAQAGQQWGNDHSPEIDPQSANRISVIKGVSALQYPGSNLGSVILIQSKKIVPEPHLHGKVGYFFESNGLSNGTHLQLQKGAPFLSWRLNISAKQSGDRKTPDYFLTNTGQKELNASLQLEKRWSQRSFGEFYISSYNTELGVLRGSHIGNLTDLNEAFDRTIPFFTQNEFSYTIASPKQVVHHHLLKVHQKFYITDSLSLDLTYAAQLNNRKEFDVRRGGRSDLPALSLRQLNQYAAAQIEKELKADWKLIGGIQFNYIDNTNNAETGIIPLIPDYISFKNSAYFLVKKKRKRSLLEMGARYDHVQQNVATISQTLPREILRYANQFHNWSSSLDWSLPLGAHKELVSNIGLAMRNPAINELYSGGLHQGVSGIELGNPDLKSERSVKGTVALNGDIREKWFFELLGYYQQIGNYVYLQPQNQFQLTIRGAFPVFKYEQTDAQLYGADASILRQISTSWSAKFKYSYLRGDDLSNKTPLIFMPSNNVGLDLVYELPKHIEIGKSELENTAISVTNRYVFKQSHLNIEQDFIAAPDAYFLLGLKASTNAQWSKSRLHFFVKVSNALNTNYRDYLNRLRYFADDMGINITLGGNLKF